MNEEQTKEDRGLLPPHYLTTPRIIEEIALYKRRPYNAKTKWAMRLFNLRQELKKRQVGK